jgi:hypothetical protein
MTNKRKMILFALAIPVILLIGGLGFVISKLGTGPYNIENTKNVIKNDFNFLYEPISLMLFSAKTENHNNLKQYGIPVLKIEFSRKDIAHFNDLLPKLFDENFGPSYYSKHNSWRKATLYFKGEKYEIKVKSHGRSPVAQHIEGRFNSLRIKLAPGKLIRGQNRFSLIVSQRISRQQVEALTFSKNQGLYILPIDLVSVKINNWEQKYFYFSPLFDNKYLETLGFSSMKRFERIIPSDQPELTNKSLIPLMKAEEISDLELKNRLKLSLEAEGIPTNHHQPITSRYIKIANHIKDRNITRLKEFFNLDYIVNYEAVRLMLGSEVHGARQDNSFLFYNQADGNIYPGVTKDHDPSRFDIGENQPAERGINDWVYDSDPAQTIHTVSFYHALNSDDEIRNRKYKLIANFIQNYDTKIKLTNDKIKEKYNNAFNYGWVSPIIKNTRWYNQSHIQNNLSTLKTYLSRTSPKVTSVVKASDLILIVEPRSMSAIGFKKLVVQGLLPNTTYAIALNQAMLSGEENIKEEPVSNRLSVSAEGSLDLTLLIEGLEFFTGVDTTTAKVPRKYVLTFSAADIDFGDVAIDLITMNNRVMGIDVTDLTVIKGTARDIPDLSKAVLRAPAPLTGGFAFNTLQKKFPAVNMTASKNKLTVHAGRYEILEDFIVPRDMKLILEAGTTLLMGEKIALMGYQGVGINGTADNPVTVTALDPKKPYGTVGFLGNKKDTSSSIHYLHQSHGNERWVNGVFFSAGLSIHYNSSVTMTNSRIQDNHADDGANFKNVDNVIIDNTIFQDNFADQIDLDYTSALVTNSQFLNTKGGDLNGDGLDISGSKVVVTKTSFTGFNDKGISVGESSDILVMNSKLHNNRNGAAVKDRSNGYFIDVDYQENVYDIASYMKKRIFGGANVVVQDLTLNDKLLSLDFDNKSKLFVMTQKPANDVWGLAKQTVNFDALFVTLGKTPTQTVRIPATYVEE